MVLRNTRTQGANELSDICLHLRIHVSQHFDTESFPGENRVLGRWAIVMALTERRTLGFARSCELALTLANPKPPELPMYCMCVDLLGALCAVWHDRWW